MPRFSPAGYAKECKNANANHYFVVGEVMKPRPVKSDGSLKSLVTLISEAGGFREYAYLKKIQVVHAGVTNTFDYRLIKQGKTSDPSVPLGATVVVRKTLPFLD
jgi:protein involved in polysaccharide export with SLBB domain